LISFSVEVRREVAGAEQRVVVLPRQEASTVTEGSSPA
jgi:hypothetical protein